MRQARRFRAAAIALLLLALSALEGNARFAPRYLRSEFEASITRHHGTTAESLLYPHNGEQLPGRGEDHLPGASAIKIPALAKYFQQNPQRRQQLEAFSGAGEAAQAPGRDYAPQILTTDNIDQSWSIDNDAHLLVSGLAHSMHYLIDGLTTAY